MQEPVAIKMPIIKTCCKRDNNRYYGTQTGFNIFTKFYAKGSNAFISDCFAVTLKFSNY